MLPSQTFSMLQLLVQRMVACKLATHVAAWACLGEVLQDGRQLLMPVLLRVLDLPVMQA